MTLAAWSLPVEVRKLDSDRQLVSGWLSVAADEQGRLVVDSQGDVIEAEELESAAYDYLLNARGVAEMHLVKGIGRPVESMVFTVEKQKALGIPEGVLPVGWWVTFKIDSPAVWAKVKSGEYRAFSIGGVATREEVSVADEAQGSTGG